MSNIDKLKKIIREFENEPGIGQNDHDVALAILAQLCIPHYVCTGTLLLNGEDEATARWTKNKLTKYGPALLVTRAFEPTVNEQAAAITVPAKPSIIQLGTSNTDWAATQNGCVSAVSYASLGGTGGAAADSVVSGTVDANHPGDRVTFTKDFGSQAALGGNTPTIQEMALLNTTAAPTNSWGNTTYLAWGRLWGINRQVTLNDSIIAKYRVQSIPG